MGAAVPVQLAEFLRVSNGFSDLASRYPYGWDLTTIVSENSRAWSDAVTPLDRDLLAFGADGAGGWFCLSLDPREQQVFHWTWIEGRAVPVADNLSAFWPSWLSGDLKI